MADFEFGEAVQVKSVGDGWQDGWRYCGAYADLLSGEYFTVERHGKTYSRRRENVRRAPRVIKQMCQWYRSRSDDTLTAHPLSGLWAVSNHNLYWQKVGEPFEQTLEVPE